AELNCVGPKHPVASGQVRREERAPERRQLPLERRDRLAAVEVPAAVAIAVDREQHLRLDLGEAFDDAADAELWRATRPGGADARTAEEGRNRLGDVGEIGGDAVACDDACLAQGAGDSAGTRPKLAP